MSSDSLKSIPQRLVGMRFYRSPRFWFYTFYIVVALFVIPLTIAYAVAFSLSPSKMDRNLSGYSRLVYAMCGFRGEASYKHVFDVAQNVREKTTDPDIQELADLLIFIANTNGQAGNQQFACLDFAVVRDEISTIEYGQSHPLALGIVRNINSYMGAASEHVDLQSIDFSGLIVRLDNRYAQERHANSLQGEFANNAATFAHLFTLTLAIALLIWLTWEDYLLGWRNTLNFAGHSSRAEYWTFYLNNFIILFSLLYVMEIIFKVVSLGGGILVGFLELVLYLPMLSLVVRRLQDAGLSPKLAVIPAVLGISIIAGGFLGENAWGFPLIFFGLPFYVLTVTIIGMFPTAGEAAVPEEQPV